MNDLIAGIAAVEQVGKRFTSEEEVALESELNKLLEEIRRRENVQTANSCLNQLAHP